MAGPSPASQDGTEALPQALVTVGNGALQRCSELLVERLRPRAQPETVAFPDDHDPLPHEYQFDPGSDAGRLFFERPLAFPAKTTASPRARRSGADQAG